MTPLQINRMAHLARLVVASIMMGGFAVLAVLGAPGQSYSPEERLAAQAVRIETLTQEQSALRSAIMESTQRMSAISDRLTRVEMFGAACGLILTVLQGLSSLTGKKIKADG